MLLMVVVILVTGSIVRCGRLVPGEALEGMGYSILGATRTGREEKVHILENYSVFSVFNASNGDSLIDYLDSLRRLPPEVAAAKQDAASLEEINSSTQSVIEILNRNRQLPAVTTPMTVSLSTMAQQGRGQTLESAEASDFKAIDGGLSQTSLTGSPATPTADEKSVETLEAATDRGTISGGLVPTRTETPATIDSQPDIEQVVIFSTAAIQAVEDEFEPSAANDDDDQTDSADKSPAEGTKALIEIGLLSDPQINTSTSPTVANHQKGKGILNAADEFEPDEVQDADDQSHLESVASTSVSSTTSTIENVPTNGQQWESQDADGTTDPQRNREIEEANQESLGATKGIDQLISDESEIEAFNGPADPDSSTLELITNVAENRTLTIEIAEDKYNQTPYSAQIEAGLVVGIALGVAVVVFSIGCIISVMVCRRKSTPRNLNNNTPNPIVCFFERRHVYATMEDNAGTGISKQFRKPGPPVILPHEYDVYTLKDSTSTNGNIIIFDSSGDPAADPPAGHRSHNSQHHPPPCTQNASDQVTVL